MMKSKPAHAVQAMERIVELLADAQIKRRMTAKDSPSFHNLTGAIAAYAKALALLTALQQREEFYATIGQYDLTSASQKVRERVEHQHVA